MDRVQRALSLLVALGGVVPALSACQGMGSGLGMLLNIALAVGVSVGTYFLIKELS